MKKLLLLVLSVVLISGCVAQEEPAPADDAAEETLLTFEMVDKKRNVTVEYPAGWAGYSLSGIDIAALDWGDEDIFKDGSAVVFHKHSDIIAEWEPDGSIVYDSIDNLDGLSLKEYLDAEYDECVAQEMPEGPEFGPICVHMDIENWESMEVSGYPAYLSERRGMPSSGETAKDLYVDAGEFFVNLMSVATGNALAANEDFVENVFDVAVDTLTIE